MINFRKYITRSPRIVSEKYLDDIAANTSFSTSLDHGINGFKVITSTSGTISDNDYYAIKAVEGPATISVVSNAGDDLTDLDIISGDIIFGNFSSVTVTSGKVLVYIK